MFVRSPKVIYAKLSGLSKKAIDCALKADMHHGLVNLLKIFIYDAQNKNIQVEDIGAINVRVEDIGAINNPAITKYKGRPPKDLNRVWKQLHYKEEGC